MELLIPLLTRDRPGLMWAITCNISRFMIAVYVCFNEGIRIAILVRAA